jgi:hypothetical protein
MALRSITNPRVDEHFRRWPFEITPQEEASEGYLKSLTPAEELAVFLSIRRMCQREAGQIGNAVRSFAAAARLARAALPTGCWRIGSPRKRVPKNSSKLSNSEVHYENTTPHLNTLNLSLPTFTALSPGLLQPREGAMDKP